jgi:lysozyme
MNYIKGCDISVYQHERDPAGHPTGTPVDFQKMKAAGIKFAWVRAITLAGGVDAAFMLNWNGLKSVGIPRGAYGFANQFDPIGYASRLHDVVSATGDMGELPPALDYESGQLTYSATLSWLQHVEALWGRRPIIYTSKSKWYVAAPPWTSSYPLWVASWKSAPPPTMPAGWSDWSVWQVGTPAYGLQYGVRSKEIDADVMREETLAAWLGQKTLEQEVTALKQRVSELELRVSALEARC